MAQRNPVPAIVETTGNDAPLVDDTGAYIPRTDLGRRLMALRREIVKSGTPLLDWDDLDREIAERRGGVALAEFEARNRS